MIAIAAALALAPAAAPTAEGPTDCDAAQTQADMNLCAARDLASSEAALAAQWAETVERMKALDARIDRENDKQPSYFNTLLDGQRAWLAFRDAQCLSESFMARGGSMQPMLDLQCKTYMTELRIQQLRNPSATL